MARVELAARRHRDLVPGHLAEQLTMYLGELDRGAIDPHTEAPVRRARVNW
jgi:hypothetical protein